MTNYFGDAASVDAIVTSGATLEDDGMPEDPFINIQDAGSESLQNEAAQPSAGGAS